MKRIDPAYPLDVSAKEAAFHILKGIPSLIKLLYRLLKDPDTPFAVKLWISGTALYIISPFNLIFSKSRFFAFRLFDIIDDIILILVTLQKTFKKTPFDILEKYWDYSMPIEEWNDLVFKIYSDLKTIK